MLAALAPGAIWAQMSTIGVAGIDRVAAMAGTERPDVMLLDAPVSGSKDPAERGQLTIFASGPGQARARVAPLFGALGQRTIWVGEPGAGTRLKLVNNTLIGRRRRGCSRGRARPAGLQRLRNPRKGRPGFQLASQAASGRVVRLGGLAVSISVT